jgi:hypothetical protein
VPREGAAPLAAPQSPSCPRLDRTAQTCQLRDLEVARRARGVSLRTFAAETDTPRSTLQGRLHAVQDDGLPAGWQPFFESDVGPGFVLRLRRRSIRRVCCVCGCPASSFAITACSYRPEARRPIVNELLARCWRTVRFCCFIV